MAESNEIQEQVLDQGTTQSAEQIAEESRKFLAQVYNWMGLGLALTGLVALGISAYPPALQLIVANPIIFYGALILEFVVVIAFVAINQKASARTAIVMFLVYAALNGVTFSLIFTAYTSSSIARTFFVTAGTFVATSAFGYFTKRDLSGVGHFMFMGLIGLIIAMVVNLFLASPMIYWLTTFMGVLIFTGLTAYDTQKLKKTYISGRRGAEAVTKGAVNGALALYLDFINMFLFLLRLFGGRD